MKVWSQWWNSYLSNTDLDENDIEEIMVRALGNESSVAAPHSSAATHVFDNDDEVYLGTI